MSLHNLLLSSLVLTTTTTTTHAFSPHPQYHVSTSLSARRLPPPNDDNDKKPAWLENAQYWAKQEELRQNKKKPIQPARNKIPAPGIGDNIGGIPVDRSPWDEGGGNTFAHLYNSKSTDEFKLPFEDQADIVQRLERTNASKNNRRMEFRRDVTDNGSVPEWFGASQQRQQQQQQLPLRSANDAKAQFTIDASSNPYGEGHKKHSFQTSNSLDFRRPHDGQQRDSTNAAVPEWFGSNQPRERRMDQPAVNSHALNSQFSDKSTAKQVNHAQNNPYGEGGKRHSFQMSTTDDFRKPYDSISTNYMSSKQLPQQQPYLPSTNAKRRLLKSPFQTSTTEDFKRISDTGTSANAPQQPIYAEFTSSSKTTTTSPAWTNSVGQDTYESTQLPQSKPLGGVHHPDTKGYRTNPSQSAAILTVETKMKDERQKRRSWNDKGLSLVRSIQWSDPPSDTTHYPLWVTRACITIIATVATRQLHLMNGFSPVLASSVLSFLVSNCFDKRLGNVALCGTLVGMSGRQILPNIPMTLALGGVTSVLYEIVLRMNNVFDGIGGRVGAVAFLSTSIMARYARVGGVGRKLRRGLWKAGVGPSDIVVSMILFHVIGALATILLRQCSEEDGAADPVRAGSVVGILGSLFVSDPTALMALYGGSFVGMSLPSRLTHGCIDGSRIRQSATSFIGSFAAAGALAGLIHAITIHNGYWNGGWGGKAGLCAFAGCWVYRGLDNMIRINKK